MSAEELISRIQAALGTEETGEALVEVARNAHRAEQELAAAELRRADPAPIPDWAAGGDGS